MCRIHFVLCMNEREEKKSTKARTFNLCCAFLLQANCFAIQLICDVVFHFVSEYIQIIFFCAQFIFVVISSVVQRYKPHWHICVMRAYKWNCNKIGISLFATGITPKRSNWILSTSSSSLPTFLRSSLPPRLRFQTKWLAVVCEWIYMMFTIINLSREIALNMLTLRLINCGL